MELLIETDKVEQILSNKDLAKIYDRIFSTNDGKIVLQDLATVSGMYRTNFTQNNSDYTSFLEGQRALFLYICSQLENNITNIEGKNIC